MSLRLVRVRLHWNKMKTKPSIDLVNLMPNLQSLSSVHKTEMFLLSIPKCELSSHNFIMVECCINWWPQFNPSISKKSWKEQEKMWIIYRLEIVDRRLWYVWLQFSYCVFNWSDIMSPSGLILIHIDRKPIQARYSFRCEHISSTNHSNNAAIAFGWFDHELQTMHSFIFSIFS